MADLGRVDTAPRRFWTTLALSWLGFWVTMVAIGLLVASSEGERDLWRPVIHEGSSMLVASVLLVLQWRLARRFDAQLHRPARWFRRVLAWLPLVALAFVGATQALRAGAYALRGLPYQHEPWVELLVTETLKFSVFCVLFVGVVFGARSYFAWSAERLRAERSERLAQQAQLLQLTQQLAPHFLFNALNTVSSLIHTAPERADALLTQLALLLRAATDAGQRTEQPLADELELLRAYASIMAERFGDRVSIAWRIEDGLDACAVPTLGLQPLLENCFRHAVEPRRAPTAIEVSARRAGDRLVIEVADDGGTITAPPAFGVGLGNLQRRLQTLHGEQAKVELRARDGGGVVARVELPCAC